MLKNNVEITSSDMNVDFENRIISWTISITKGVYSLVIKGIFSTLDKGVIEGS